jgi:hypothetical protein
MTDTTVDRPKRRTIASMEQAARRILAARRVDPDGLADQGDLAADLGVQRRTISVYRQVYRGPGADGSASLRGRGRNGPRPSTGEAGIEAFPKPDLTVGGGGGAPVWRHRWVGLAWALTREQALDGLPESERALIADLL